MLKLNILAQRPWEKNLALTFCQVSQKNNFLSLTSVAVTSAFDRLQVETAPEEAETKLFLESHRTDF